MRLLKRSEPVDIEVPEPVLEDIAVATVIGNPVFSDVHISQTLYMTGPDGGLVKSTLTPAPLFKVGDRFQSAMTGLKVELIEAGDYTDDKGYMWTVRCVAAGDNSHVKRGELVPTYEATLAADFEQIAEGPEKPEKVKKEKSVKAEKPAAPKVALPQVFSPGVLWSDWPMPNLSGGTLTAYRVAQSADLNLTLYQIETGEVLGGVSETALGELGKRAGFPPEFVGKLSPATAAIVINERITQAKPEPVTVVFEDTKFSNLVPSWRGILPTKQVAELAYLQLKGWYPDIEVETAERGEGWARLRFLTPVAYPVSDAPNDLLRLGLDISHQYGDTLRVALYTRSTSANGGMLSHVCEYSWRQRSGDAGSAEHQAAWLSETITACVCAFPLLVERAMLMAATPFIGAANRVIEARVKALGLGKRSVSSLQETWTHSGDGFTEWDLWRAFARYTAKEEDQETARRLMQAIGIWVESFEADNATSLPTLVQEGDNDS